MYCITVFAMSDVKANCCHRLPSAGRRWRQQDSCISLLILSFAIHQLCFHTFKCWLFKTCQQPRQVSHLLLSHDIQTFNQGHKIAAICFLYIRWKNYDCRQHLALIYHIFLLTLSSTQTLNISGDRNTVIESRYFSL